MSNEVVAFQQALVNQREAIVSRLPQHMASHGDRIIKTVVTAAMKNPAILKCSKDSILLSVFQSLDLGLEIGNALGEAYLVPYGATCQMIPGYRGLVSLARRSGKIRTIEARIVRDGDEFDFSLGTNPTLTHKPAFSDKPAEMRAVYAIAFFNDGSTQFEVMVKAEVDAIRKRSRASGSGPWVTDYEEMAKKTVVRRLSKYLPLSPELSQALEIQAMAEAGDFGDGCAPKVTHDDLNAKARAAAMNRGAVDVSTDPGDDSAPMEYPPHDGSEAIDA